MDVYRGDIFIVKEANGSVGSEQKGNRPAIVVSNDIGNHYSNICEVVYLTSRKKKPLPTHVSILLKTPSTALCEQISTVSKDRLVKYMRTCTYEEMKKIDNAILISLGFSYGGGGDHANSV